MSEKTVKTFRSDEHGRLHVRQRVRAVEGEPGLRTRRVVSKGKKGRLRVRVVEMQAHEPPRLVAAPTLRKGG